VSMLHFYRVVLVCSVLFSSHRIAYAGSNKGSSLSGFSINLPNDGGTLTVRNRDALESKGPSFMGDIEISPFEGLFDVNLSGKRYVGKRTQIISNPATKAITVVLGLAKSEKEARVKTNFLNKNTITFELDRFEGPSSKTGSDSGPIDLRYYLTGVSGYSESKEFSFEKFTFKDIERPLYYPNPEGLARAGFQFQLDDGKLFTLRTMKVEKFRGENGKKTNQQDPLWNAFEITIGDQRYHGKTIRRESYGDGRGAIYLLLSPPTPEKKSLFSFLKPKPKHNLLDGPSLVLYLQAVTETTRESGPLEYRLLTLTDGSSLASTLFPLQKVLDKGKYVFDKEKLFLPFYPIDCWAALGKEL